MASLGGRQHLSIAAGLVGLVIGCATSAWAQDVTPAVLVAAAELKPFGWQVEYIGRVQAIDKVDLRARVQGFLGPRLFRDGDAVKKEQVLFRIEREPFLAAVNQRKAQLAAAEARAQNAQQQLHRARELTARDALSQAQLDQRIADDAQARASVLEAKAALEEAEIKLSYTEIRAPIDGRIGRAIVSPGNLVGAENTTLATIVHEEQMYVLFAVPQRDLMEARRGGSGDDLSVGVRLADGSLMGAFGKLDFLDVQVDPRTDGQIVRAIFANSERALTDGQTVRVLIRPQAAAKVLTIPQAAVVSDQAGQYVFVIGKDNTVEQRRVKLGDSRDGRAVVEGGISEGERIVVQGQQRVRPGVKVQPQFMPAPKN